MWQSKAAQAGASLVWPVFNYGRLINQVRVQDAAFQQAVLNYQNTVLTAQQEVENGLSAFYTEMQALGNLSTAATTARRSTELSLNQYKAGEADYTTMLSTEQAQLSVEDSIGHSQGNVALGLISIYRALGGGWEIRAGRDVISDEVKAQMRQRTNWGQMLKPEQHLPKVSPVEANRRKEAEQIDLKIAFNPWVQVSIGAHFGKSARPHGPVVRLSQRERHQTITPPSVTISHPMSQPVTEYLDLTGTTRGIEERGPDGARHRLSRIRELQGRRFRRDGAIVLRYRAAVLRAAGRIEPGAVGAGASRIRPATGADQGKGHLDLERRETVELTRPGAGPGGAGENQSRLHPRHRALRRAHRAAAG